MCVYDVKKRPIFYSRQRYTRRRFPRAFVRVPVHTDIIIIILVYIRVAQVSRETEDDADEWCVFVILYLNLFIRDRGPREKSRRRRWTGRLPENGKFAMRKRRRGNARIDGGADGRTRTHNICAVNRYIDGGGSVWFACVKRLLFSLGTLSRLSVWTAPIHNVKLTEIATWS